MTTFRTGICVCGKTKEEHAIGKNEAYNCNQFQDSGLKALHDHAEALAEAALELRLCWSGSGASGQEIEAAVNKLDSILNQLRKP